jgi:hypothetical protein
MQESQEESTAEIVVDKQSLVRLSGEPLLSQLAITTRVHVYAARLLFSGLLQP